MAQNSTTIRSLSLTTRGRQPTYRIFPPTIAAVLSVVGPWLHRSGNLQGGGGTVAETLIRSLAEPACASQTSAASIIVQKTAVRFIETPVYIVVRAFSSVRSDYASRVVISVRISAIYGARVAKEWPREAIN